MAQQSRNATDETTRLADTWVGRTVTISGKGGTIIVNPKDRTSVSTHRRKAVSIVIEPAPANFGRGLVAFRVSGTNRYLTVVLYGDEVRQSMADELGRTPILSELIPDVVDYAAGRGSSDDNFEGPGFSYSPMTAQEGPPGLLQVFELEHAARLHHFGVKTKFNTYWRSQHWNKTVSQSPHLLGDETWNFSVQRE